MDLMGIGEFAQRSRLSHKALRLYDELGLLPPAMVDPHSGYRWYAAGQLDRARLVASLRQLDVPLARIREIVDLDPGGAAGQVACYWTSVEAEHAVRRELAGYLVDRLRGKDTMMHDVSLREVPARSMLCKLQHVHTDDLVATGKDLIARLRVIARPPAGDPVSAPFIIFYGEVTQDSDGPAEWCWPVPADRAEEIAAGFADLTLRTEPAHTEAFVSVGRLLGAQAGPAIESLMTWAAREHRETAGGVRQIMIFNPDSGGNGPDGQYAITLR